MATSFRRRNFFTKKDFQTRFALPFLLASLLVNITTVTLFIFMARSKMDNVLFSMRIPRTSVGAFLAPIAFIAICSAIIAVSLLFLWAARGMYHKIAGPLFQIRTELRTLQQNDLSTPIILREVDEFKDFAGEINSIIELFNRHFTALKVNAEALAKTVDTLKTSQDAEAKRAAMHTVKGLVKSMDEQTRAFTL